MDTESGDLLDLEEYEESDDEDEEDDDDEFFEEEKGAEAQGDGEGKQVSVKLPVWIVFAAQKDIFRNDTITCLTSEVESEVRKVQIGRVPDRGGRADEVRQIEIDNIPFSQFGRKGGRGKGRGRGRGGGRRGGGGGYNNHNRRGGGGGRRGMIPISECPLCFCGRMNLQNWLLWCF